MTIRFAAERDLEKIREIERLSFPSRKRWASGDFQDALEGFFLVFDDVEPRGFLVASCWEDTKRAVILRIAVHPDSRNRGVATRLIEAAIGRFREMDLREVGIDVEIVKAGAVRLYEKIGFQTVLGIPMSGNDSMNNEDGSFYMMKMTIGGP